uniref:Molybdopterin molybdenumtransferase n=1 Tax=Neobacillus citreus TaxID=2833578 RepID=A0A942SZ11_9BACI
MRTIGQHRAAVETLVGPVLSGLATAPDGQEARHVDDLATDPSGGRASRLLARAVVAPGPLPAFENSQMDGFAVHTADAGATVLVVAPVPAGAVPAALERGTAAPIMTGARIPAGADAVFPVERTDVGAFPAALTLESVRVPTDLRPGTFVRSVGSDLAAGAVIADAGSPVTPALLGALAAAGVDTVHLVRRPRVLVVSTGSELVSTRSELVSTRSELVSTGSGSVSTASEPVSTGSGRVSAGAALDDGAGAGIRDANGVALRAALAEVAVESRVVQVPDDTGSFVDALAQAVGDWADLVLTTGGISAGAYEVVRQALEPLGLTVTPVAMQPGGPQALGTIRLAGRPVPVLSFPGNPVSALVSFEVFLRPMLAAAVGLPADRPTSTLPAAGHADSPPGKHQVRRGRVEDGRVHFVGGPSSHLLAHYAAATHLVHVPVGTATVAPGDPLTVWSLR